MVSSQVGQQQTRRRITQHNGHAAAVEVRQRDAAAPRGIDRRVDPGRDVALWISRPSSKLSRRLRTSRLALPTSARRPSTVISLEWTNGGAACHTRQSAAIRGRACAGVAQSRTGWLPCPGTTQSTRMPRRAAIF